MPESKIWNNDLPLGRLLSLLTKGYFGALTKKMEHLDIERYYMILLGIESFQGKNCSQQSLCDTLQFDKASMVKRIKYFVKLGLVNRTENPYDRREHCICLTEKAKSIMPELHKAINELNAEATLGLDNHQKEEFYKALEIVYDNISGLPAHKVSYNLKKIK